MSSGSNSPECTGQTVGKQPLKKLQFALTRITKVVSLHLSILKNQKTNIEKLKESAQWDKLQSELINASRTVQQLKADMHELGIVRQQVVTEDLIQFDNEARQIQNEILMEIAIFIEMHMDALTPASSFQTQRSVEISGESERQHHSLLTTSSVEVTSENSTSFGVEGNVQELRDCDKLMSLDACLQDNQKATTAFKSWSHLNKELHDLRSLIDKFTNLVMRQREDLNKIDTNVDDSRNNVLGGANHLSKAAKLKVAMVPLTGAAIGGLIGGPIGLISGVKMAGAVAALGSAIGFTVARVIKSRMQKKIDGDMELLELNHGETDALLNSDPSKLKTS